jgi:hypothetical protein
LLDNFFRRRLTIREDDWNKTFHKSRRAAVCAQRCVAVGKVYIDGLGADVLVPWGAIANLHRASARASEGCADGLCGAAAKLLERAA